jgi:rare lipoprotein A (peptidoglycan hydrolase)
MMSLVLSIAMLFTPHPPADDLSVRTINGVATWYDASKNFAWYTQAPRKGAKSRNQDGAPYKFYAAAGPRMRKLAPFDWGEKPYRVIITNLKTNIAIVAWVVDTCGCRGGSQEKLIDLSPAAFTALGVSLGRGIQKVRVEILTPYATGAR